MRVTLRQRGGVMARKSSLKWEVWALLWCVLALTTGFSTQMVKVKSAYEPSGSSAGAYPGFSSMKRLGVFLLLPDGMLVHRRVTPSIKFAGTHLYTWVERGTVRVKCLAQEHNTMSPARARTRSAHSGVERTNHEATAPPPRPHRAPTTQMGSDKLATCLKFI